MALPLPVKQQETREASCALDIIVAGAGIGGLGAAVSCLLAGHNVHVLEAAPEIREVGAGIQILPNGSRILKHWGMEERLSKHWQVSESFEINGYKGNKISSLSLAESASQYPGTWYRTFYRPHLQMPLLERVRELGGKVSTNAKVMNVSVNPDNAGATVITGTGEVLTCELFIGADGIFGDIPDMLLDSPTPASKTGDLAYRVLLSTADLLKDPELAPFVTKPQVNFWLGPEKHVVTYNIGKDHFNVVLLVPDDIPESSSANTVKGNVEEMCALFKDWDPRLGKLLALCKEVQKWRLCTRLNTRTWSHPSGAAVMIGDCVHATLPYMAVGAGLAIEDGAVLGECLARLPNNPRISKSSNSFLKAKRHALAVFEKCRIERVRIAIMRSHRQRYLNHLPDGPEQEQRDRDMQSTPTPEGEALVWRDPGTAPTLFGWNHILEVESNWDLSPTTAETSGLVLSGARLFWVYFVGAIGQYLRFLASVVNRGGRPLPLAALERQVGVEGRKDKKRL
ncbi:FAD dependent oxidoreductase [Aspergillus heteromorphus CBS 117.55]|uniref:FAD dependent oxidoreductase n=1 Tax=Aspergillus heteromorphus CBS 117.55 TaxID=1448321 RepID=A0A317WK47_9EURO|nr:FAD dependent oxidoreductase [Aspergillus heteromorphus CBS 117.55]PWY86699.1 FAD dependent oxidoreductase [Aspergillus heteromorphus CBS 117.55]